MLRPYQQAAFDAAINHIRKCIDPCLIEAATGSGKSHIVAAIAEWVETNTNKKVLCLAPSKELTEQNHAKYLLTGNPASFFSASLGKSLAHNVVFGTPKTVLNAIHKFSDKFAAIVIDEAHGITPTIKEIVSEIRSKNKNVRVIGLSATPYRMGTGYIYQIGDDDCTLPEDLAINPYFKKLVYRITARELIDLGFLTKPIFDDPECQYETSGLKLSKTNTFTGESLKQVFDDEHRKTKLIIDQVVEFSHNRQGVMIFAATVQHAQEILSYLPKYEAKLVTGTTSKLERESIIRQFKNRQVKYLVNVAVLTTGFDAPHVDLVAILRATESVSLLQQIIGRGLRICDGKQDCLILDYAQNISTHCSGDDVFNVKIRTSTIKGSESIEVICPVCAGVNEFKPRPNEEGYNSDKYGYFLDLMGERIETDFGDMPNHFGRRCTVHSLTGGSLERCSFRWTFKPCPSCDHENDIAARYCEACKAEIVDPNKKLKLEFDKIKSDPYQTTTDSVKSWKAVEHISLAGNLMLKVTYTTEFRTFPIWYNPNGGTKAKNLWASLSQAVFGEGRIAPSVEKFLSALNGGHGKMPQTITVSKNKGSDFYEVYAHNRPEDLWKS